MSESMQQRDPLDHRTSPEAHTGADGAAAIIKSLARRGRRLTAPRQVIVNFLALRRDHFSAQEVWEDLRSTNRRVGRATVFRTLELLTEFGVLDRVRVGDGCHRYAVCQTVHHHHLMCLGCSAVVLVAAPEIEDQIRRLASEAGFELMTHHLEMIGQCAVCRLQPE